MKIVDFVTFHPLLLFFSEGLSEMVVLIPGKIQRVKYISAHHIENSESYRSCSSLLTRLCVHVLIIFLATLTFDFLGANSDLLRAFLPLFAIDLLLSPADKPLHTSINLFIFSQPFLHVLLSPTKQKQKCFNRTSKNIFQPFLVKSSYK